MTEEDLYIADLPDTLQGARPGDGDPTTLAVGEEGDEGDDPTTLAIGEEGDDT